MSTYTVTHLESGETFTLLPSSPIPSTTWAIHPPTWQRTRQSPHSTNNSPTEELGFSHVFLKDESSRFGLPSFKIAGQAGPSTEPYVSALASLPAPPLSGLKDALAAQSADHRQVAAATNGKAADLVLGSTGVGSWMHAVTSHYALASPSTKVITVEPDTAASFKESIHRGDITPIKTGDTIMCGMNCGTTSTIAWPVLRSGIHTAATVSDRESHESVEFLKTVGIDAGPCGAASIAALKKICHAGLAGTEDERKEKLVVLFSTEGNRVYEIPEV
ncbi:hypothetical protein BTJ68_13093 [Hortaea werneckii EXF-2000]|uniref:Tryptophan synthase beta chain-like PALP domain-containing protein n=1 Tax=Hortaea werneckii EXF-2000 TaxID=1157616 RepID=A0A1Z5SR04_HORWE|nr:hypothetical protein BTJ68_13093 [Hortaea werneckii EXF-2000]